MPTGGLQDAFHFADDPVEVDDDDRTVSARSVALHRTGIEDLVVSDVAHKTGRARRAGPPGRWSEGVRRDEDIVASPDPQRAQRHVERSGAAGACHGVRHARPRRPALFQLGASVPDHDATWPVRSGSRTSARVRSANCGHGGNGYGSSSHHRGGPTCHASATFRKCRRPTRVREYAFCEYAVSLRRLVERSARGRPPPHVVRGLQLALRGHGVVQHVLASPT